MGGTCIRSAFAFAVFLLICLQLNGCSGKLRTHISRVGDGWAKTQVNTVIFRKNSVVSFQDRQYTAWYDSTGTVMLAMREHGSDTWTRSRTRFSGHVQDAHNSISIMVDGEGYLHMAWDHHNHPLHYVRARSPGSLDLGEPEQMIGRQEGSVTYPEFYRLHNGDLLFLYRDGSSGNGNLVLNRYDLSQRKWIRVQDNLIDGEGERNAYWQTTVGPDGMMHLSWVWRETPDVASNHDLAYARSPDGGRTWMDFQGRELSVPITESSASYALRIPQNSNLINQTSMTADAVGRPFIATYFRSPEGGVTEVRVIYPDGTDWKTTRISNRSHDFDLSGAGTRSPPISRPQVLFDPADGRGKILVLFRDEEHGNRGCFVTVKPGAGETALLHRHLTSTNLDRWEPTLDTERWERDREIHIFLQSVGQGPGETPVFRESSPVSMLEVKNY